MHAHPLRSAACVPGDAAMTSPGNADQPTSRTARCRCAGRADDVECLSPGDGLRRADQRAQAAEVAEQHLVEVDGDRAAVRERAPTAVASASELATSISPRTMQRARVLGAALDRPGRRPAGHRVRLPARSSSRPCERGTEEGGGGGRRSGAIGCPRSAAVDVAAAQPGHRPVGKQLLQLRRAAGPTSARRSARSSMKASTRSRNVLRCTSSASTAAGSGSPRSSCALVAISAVRSASVAASNSSSSERITASRAGVTTATQRSRSSGVAEPAARVEARRAARRRCRR